MTTTHTRSRLHTVVVVALVVSATLWGTASVSHAGAFTPDPPEIPFVGQVIDVDREYTVLAGGGIDNLNADETIEDSSVTAWIADETCGDRDDPGWPTGPIILQALTLANGSDQPFLSRKVFVGPEFAGKLLCLDQGIGISTPDDYYRLYSLPRVYLLRPPPVQPPAPAPAPAPAPVEEPPAPAPAPAPQNPAPNPPPINSDNEAGVEEPNADESQPPPPVAPEPPEPASVDEDAEPPAPSVEPGDLGTVTVPVSATGGEIEIDGILHSATTTGDTLPPGTLVRVIDADNGVLLVEALETDTTTGGWWWGIGLGLVLVAAAVALVWWVVRGRRESGNPSADRHPRRTEGEGSPGI